MHYLKEDFKTNFPTHLQQLSHQHTRRENPGVEVGLQKVSEKRNFMHTCVYF